jgi:hypothetical protein
VNCPLIVAGTQVAVIDLNCLRYTETPRQEASQDAYGA